MQSQCHDLHQEADYLIRSMHQDLDQGNKIAQYKKHQINKLWLEALNTGCRPNPQVIEMLQQLKIRLKHVPYHDIQKLPFSHQSFRMYSDGGGGDPDRKECKTANSYEQFLKCHKASNCQSIASESDRYKCADLLLQRNRLEREQNQLYLAQLQQKFNLKG